MKVTLVLRLNVVMKKEIEPGIPKKNCHHPKLIIAMGGDKVCASCGCIVYCRKISSHYKHKKQK
ncbi:MAG: hypothetical protein V4608_04750 [Bacteroidota bacterium]